MKKGLATKGPHMLKMLPTYVGKPTGKEAGVYLALDLGGTNFRVIKVQLDDGRIFGTSKKSYQISEEIMRGNATQLFDFIALCVKDFMEWDGLTHFTRALFGFTFSFPVNQLGVASGTLINWTKGFTTQGVEGQDVVMLMNQAFLRNDVTAEIAVLANDTVGTMVARGYEDPNCEVGVILGTGSNACYVEDVSRITKFEGDYKGSKMIVNIEWGAFGDSTNYLPSTREDRAIDLQSLNPGRQSLEKMVSGMYLGEIVRQILLNLISEGKLGHGFSSSELLKQSHKFESAFMTSIASDVKDTLADIETLLQEKLSISSTNEERRLVREVCGVVTTRAARLAAAAIIAVLEHIGRLNDVTVAIDGSVFEHLTNFKEEMEKTIMELQPTSSIKLVLTKDGSGNGAAIIAATVASAN